MRKFCASVLCIKKNINKKGNILNQTAYSEILIFIYSIKDPLYALLLHDYIFYFSVYFTIALLYFCIIHSFIYLLEIIYKPIKYMNINFIVESIIVQN